MGGHCQCCGVMGLRAFQSDGWFGVLESVALYEAPQGPDLLSQGDSARAHGNGKPGQSINKIPFSSRENTN